MDLLGETAAGDLFHIELQSTNDPEMPVRMLEYYGQVYRLFKRFPRQILLYVDYAPLRMPAELVGPHLNFRYSAVDIRDLDGQRLLASDQVGDNVIAILTRLGDRNKTVAEILARIASQQQPVRETALRQLLKLAGLRRLEEFVEREARKMPLLDDILDNKVFAREYKRGIAEGELIALRRLIHKRFGNIPTWAEEQLAAKSSVELGDLIDRVLDVQKLEDLLE